MLLYEEQTLYLNKMVTAAPPSPGAGSLSASFNLKKIFHDGNNSVNGVYNVQCSTVQQHIAATSKMSLVERELERPNLKT